MKASWLRSNFRALIIAGRYFYLPNLFSKRHTLEVYLALNDPHSFLLIQVLGDIEKRYDITIKLLLVYETVPGVTLVPKLMRQWLLDDANFLAKLYNLAIVESSPSAQALLTGQQLWQLGPKTIENALTIFKKTWFEQHKEYFNTSTPVINYQVKNQQRLVKKGHYLPASMLFAGEWFVGIDRLAFLEEKLTQFGLNTTSKASKYTLQDVLQTPEIKNKNSFVQSIEDNVQSLSDKLPCEVFLSLRSPYSYLGFIKVKKLAEKYKIPLLIKPLLPLVMRGYQVPLNKMRYIYTDAHRIAKSAKIPFGPFNDPVGQGIHNCYEIFSYAESQNKALAFIEAAFEAIYVCNIDLANTSEIKSICEGIGLDYQQAIEHASSHYWQKWADSHQAELEQMGLWGVPCFKYGETFCWGQDRLIQIEQAFMNAKIKP